MEIVNNSHLGFIEVWLTNEEQAQYDRSELTRQLLSEVKDKKCKVAFFLSGSEDLQLNTERLLLANLRTE